MKTVFWYLTGFWLMFRAVVSACVHVVSALLFNVECKIYVTQKEIEHWAGKKP